MAKCQLCTEALGWTTPKIIVRCREFTTQSLPLKIKSDKLEQMD